MERVDRGDWIWRGWAQLRGNKAGWQPRPDSSDVGSFPLTLAPGFEKEASADGCRQMVPAFARAQCLG